MPRYLRVRRQRVLFPLIVLLCICEVANADPLQVGQTVVPPVTAGMGIVGDNLTVSVPVTFSGAGFSGTLASSVLTNDATNPFGADKLTFTYLLRNDLSSSNVLHRLTLSSFENVRIDVSTKVDGMPIVGDAPWRKPVMADRSTADVLGFSFLPLGDGPITPGHYSSLLVVHTDASAFTPTTASVIDGSIATVSSFAPLAAVPEPGTCILAALGAIGLVGFHRRVRR
jgi:hypothetical protein